MTIPTVFMFRSWRGLVPKHPANVAPAIAEAAATAARCTEDVVSLALAMQAVQMQAWLQDRQTRTVENGYSPELLLPDIIKMLAETAERHFPDPVMDNPKPAPIDHACPPSHDPALNPDIPNEEAA